MLRNQKIVYTDSIGDCSFAVASDMGNGDHRAKVLLGAGNGGDIRQRQKDAVRMKVKAISRRFKIAQTHNARPHDDELEAAGLLLDLLESCLAYCWEQGSGLYASAC